MKLQEYHAKTLLREQGLPVPDYTVVDGPALAREAAARYLAAGADKVVIKAQVLVGGRGKAGGVKLASTPEEAATVATAILGMDIKGSLVRRALVAPAADIVHEYYLACVLDRGARKVLFMGSAQGGVEIETVAEENPGAISYIHAHPHLGLLDYQARLLGFDLGLAAHLKEFAAIAKGLYATMIASDADLVEINPLAIVRTTDPQTGSAAESLQCLDAKITLDDSALHRHPALEAMRDLDEEDPVDVSAREQGISFIRLDGTIGCMVNGAGLAMTTMDLIKRAGGEPANFLDIGGGAKADKVEAAMRLILADHSVQAILVNIFGGIARGDEVAHGLVEARRMQERHVPMVVRIVGTNSEEAARILAEAGDPDIQTAVSLDDAVEKAVAAARAEFGRQRSESGVSILVDENTRLLVQGITGREGTFHAQQMQDYGTNVVGGVTPGKGGQSVLSRPVPVFDTVWSAVQATGANTSVIYVPAGGAPDSILEAVGAGIKTVICITEHIPALDMLRVVPVVDQAGARLIGPNCPGLTSVGKAKVGIIPGNIHKRGSVGLVSRSGTLTYEVVEALTEAGIGQSTCVGIGGDPITGSSFIDILSLFRDDPETEALVLIGEIGGTAEEQAAAWKQEHLPNTPMVAFIAGRTAPPGRRMGHAGAIISGGSGTAQSKVDALEAAGVHVAETPSQIPALLMRAGVRAN